MMLGGELPSVLDDGMRWSATMRISSASYVCVCVNSATDALGLSYIHVRWSDDQLPAHVIGVCCCKYGTSQKLCEHKNVT
jgi:hypothetical protein